MNEKIYQTLKSAETEDWLDYHVVRPFSYHWARFFARFNIHPNTVTIWSMFIGAASAIFFAHGSFHYEGWMGLTYNLIGILLLAVADILDCTDGQLARMTNKKSRLGRILDGASGFTWFIPIYSALVYRFYTHHDIEFGWLGLSDTPTTVWIATGVAFVLALISGLAGIAGQQRLADYYIQAHLFFLKGEEGSELDNSAQQQAILEQTDWTGRKAEKVFQKSYVDYTKKQEKVTPQFQRLLSLLKDKNGSTDHMPEEVREAFHAQSLPLMTWNGLLTFNFRSAWLFLFCLLDVPVVHFLFESIVMGLIWLYVNRRHERFCREIADKLESTR